MADEFWLAHLIAERSKVLPLPWGEGTSMARSLKSWLADEFWLAHSIAERSKVLPLPKGEGWGEGERAQLM